MNADFFIERYFRFQDILDSRPPISSYQIPCNSTLIPILKNKRFPVFLEGGLFTKNSIHLDIFDGFLDLFFIFTDLHFTKLMDRLVFE